MERLIVNFLLTYQWHIFITIEILFFVFFLLFGFFRYFLNKRKISNIFLILFFSLIIVEALLAIIVYKLTGEFSQFQLIIIIFVIYALTFGIADFLNLDRWMRKKIGSWRNIELLTEKDYAIMERNKNPKYIAEKYR